VLCIRRARTTTLTCSMIRFRMTLRRRRHSHPTVQVPTPAPHSRPTVPRSRPSGGARQRNRRTAVSMRTRDVQANLLTSLMIRNGKCRTRGWHMKSTWCSRFLGRMMRDVCKIWNRFLHFVGVFCIFQSSVFQASVWLSFIFTVFSVSFLLCHAFSLSSAAKRCYFMTSSDVVVRHMFIQRAVFFRV